MGLFPDKHTVWEMIKQQSADDGVTIKTLIIGILAFIFPMLPYITLVVFLVFLDFLSAILQAKQLGVIITSLRMRDTIWKLLGYIITILCFQVLNELVPIINWLPLICGYIAVVEAYSIGENLSYSSKVNYVKAILRYGFKKVSSSTSQSLQEVFQNIELEKAEKLNKERSGLHRRIINRSISMKFSDIIKGSARETANAIEKIDGYISIKNDAGEDVVVTNVIENEEDYQVYKSYFKPGKLHTDSSNMDYLYYMYIQSGNIELVQGSTKMVLKEGSFFEGRSMPSISYISAEGCMLLFLTTKDPKYYININKHLSKTLI